MNSFSLRKTCALISGLLLAWPILGRAETNAALRLQVRTPAVWQVLPEQRFADLFAGSLREALADHGYLQPVTVLGTMEDPASVPYLLTITVTDWHVAEGGNIACSFSAQLKTPAGERAVGDYADTVWSPGVIYPNSGYAYYPLSGTAIRDLCARLAATELPKGAPITRAAPKPSPRRSASFANWRPSPSF